MARPKREPGVPTARARIEDAFWELLEEMPYKDLTVSALSSRAQVNHNTFYYHFHSIDDMAKEFVEGSLLTDVPRSMMVALRGGERSWIDAVASCFVETDDMELRFHRLCILLGDPSAHWAVELLQGTMRGLWLEALGVGEKELSPEVRMRLAFVFGGLMALLRELPSVSFVEPSADEMVQRLRAFGESDLGEAVAETLKGLRAGAAGR
ncbi:MAG: TetR/AcrR family transcriptional regulator [Eggerthellaceae bacterium]|nr:TetR/AcrR family transcriptional regulator [Eggerthellaceae bacterium]